METTNETNETVAPVHYNPNQLVTYKVIDLDATDQAISYPTSKVTSIEWELEQGRRNLKSLLGLQNSVNKLENSLSDWIENEDSADTIVSEICNIFGFNPTKQIEFEATATFSGTISVPLSELADFDINSVDFNVDVNSWSHDVDVDNIEVDDVRSL